MHVPPEIREKLPRRNIPVAIEPGAALPAVEGFEDAFVIRVVEAVIGDAGGDEAGGGFLVETGGFDEALEVPGVADAAGVRGGVEAWASLSAVRKDLGGAAAGGDPGRHQLQV
jgi:hypothetical protein